MNKAASPAADGRTAVRPGGVPAGVSRRRILTGAFWLSIGGLAFAAGATVVNNLWPRRVEPFGGPVSVEAPQIPRPGDPPLANLDGHFLLVNLAPDEGRMKEDAEPSPGGLLALHWKCPHLGCTVPWNDSYVYPGDGRRGWFQCPCHGSTYTKAGVLVRGPATRSMDTMRIEVDGAGNLVVQTGDRTAGDDDNPRRALPWPPA